MVKPNVKKKNTHVATTTRFTKKFQYKKAPMAWSEQEKTHHGFKKKLAIRLRVRKTEELATTSSSAAIVFFPNTHA